MHALKFYITLIRQDDLQKWESFYLSPNLLLPEHEVDVTSKTSSYAGYDEHGNPVTIQFPLIELMELKVQEEQKSALAMLSQEFIGRSRAEKKEHLLDTFELIEQLKKDVIKNETLNSYPSVLNSLNYIEQEISTLYARLLSSPLETTPQELTFTSPSKRTVSSPPTTFTYTGLKHSKTKRERDTAKDKLDSFVRGLIKAELVSKFSIDKQTESFTAVLKELKKVFKGYEGAHSVIWTGSNEELKYLIHQLQVLNLIEKTANQGHWKVTISCFKRKDGLDFTNNQIHRAHFPSNTKVLDNLIHHLIFSTP